MVKLQRSEPPDRAVAVERSHRVLGDAGVFQGLPGGKTRIRGCGLTEEANSGGSEGMGKRRWDRRRRTVGMASAMDNAISI